MPIFDQLVIEEALLRTDSRNWCILNHGAPDAIVMGISAKREEVIERNKHAERDIPIVRRFSGGGTVYIDPSTCFVTFIANSEEMGIASVSESVHHWAMEIYLKAFVAHPFDFIENDYVIEGRKCGGNAQYLQRHRWLHHTSFLWDFSSDKMETLLFPPKVPQYRQKRGHDDFLCRLKKWYNSPAALLATIRESLLQRFPSYCVAQEEVMPLLNHSHRKATEQIYP